MAEHLRSMISTAQSDLHGAEVLNHEGFDPDSGCDADLAKCDGTDGGIIAGELLHDKRSPDAKRSLVLSQKTNDNHQSP